jgi:hypothetical protein
MRLESNERTSYAPASGMFLRILLSSLFIMLIAFLVWTLKNYIFGATNQTERQAARTGTLVVNSKAMH